MSSIPQRKFFSIIDGIIGGEKEGPLTPSPKKCGVLIAGFNPIAVDLVATRLMGFDYRQIPKFRILTNKKNQEERYLLSNAKDFSRISIISNVSEYKNLMINEIDRFLSFIPSKGWTGNIEI